MDPLLFTVVLSAPLFVGVTLSQFLKMPLKGLTGIYGLLVAANVLIGYFLLGGIWIPALIAGAVGVVVAAITIGFLGKLMGPSDYAFLMAGVGLFPWTLWGFTTAIVYGIILTLLVVLVALRPKFKNPFVRRFK